MSDLALDPATGDLALEQGELRLVHGAEAVAQDWRLRLTLFKGEWFMDRRVGIDYAADVFGLPAGHVLLRHVFETVTRETAGVVALERMQFDFDHGRSRELTVDAVVRTTAGDVLPLVFHDVLFTGDA